MLYQIRYERRFINGLDLNDFKFENDTIPNNTMRKILLDDTNIKVLIIADTNFQINKNGIWYRDDNNEWDLIEIIKDSDIMIIPIDKQIRITCNEKMIY